MIKKAACIATAVLLTACGNGGEQSSPDEDSSAQAIIAAAPRADAPSSARNTFSDSCALPSGPRLDGPNVVIDSAADEPRLDPQGESYVLRVPAALWKAVRDAVPGFVAPVEADYVPDMQLWARTMKPRPPVFAVVGDFDGDKRVDLAIEGASAQACATAVVAVLNRRGAPRTYVIMRWERKRDPIWTFLSHYKPGRVRGFAAADTATLTTDAVELNYFEKAGELYFYRSGGWRRLTTSD